MSPIPILLVLIVVGILLWAVNSFIPIDSKFKTLINVVAIVFAVIWLLKVLGLWSYIYSVKV